MADGGNFKTKWNFRDVRNSPLQSMEVTAELVSVLKDSLSTGCDEDVSKEEVLDTVAVLARRDDFRQLATDAELLVCAVEHLSSPELPVQFQTLRVMGNLCYENDKARRLLLSCGAHKHAAELVRQWSDGNSQVERKHRLVACGCTLNMCADNETLSKEVSDLGVIETLVAHCKDATDDGLVDMALKALAAITDSYAPASKTLLECNGGGTLSKLIKCLLANEDVEYASTLLDLVHTLVESGEERGGWSGACRAAVVLPGDEWKVVMCHNGGIEDMLTLKDHDLKIKAADILVLVLSEDTSMQQLFDGGKILSLAQEWLVSPSGSSSYLQATGALLVANMARSDGNCRALMDAGVVVQLVDLLKAEQPPEDVVQAGLGCLRNLAIPVENRMKLFDKGVAEVALKLLHSSSHKVQFKGLGTLRIMANKQSAICDHIGGSRRSVERICELCALGSHLEMEGCRLLATLVKYSKDVVEVCDGSKWLVQLLHSDHPTMVNEGLLAISVVCSHVRVGGGVGAEKLQGTSVVKDVLGLLSGVEESASQEMLCNALALVLHLCQQDVFKAAIQGNKAFVNDTLAKLQGHTTDEVVLRAKQLQKELKETEE